MQSRSWENLESFVRKEAGVSSKKAITPDSTVGDDLGQHGDDADIFMQRFFETFGVEEGDYDFRRYFLMEGEGLLYHFIYRFILRKGHSMKREALTVGMLRHAMLRGKWESESLSLKRDS